MAGVLNFRDRSVQPIREGAQRLTIRPAGGPYRRGDVVKAMVRRRPAFADLRIESVRRAHLDELKARHAAQDQHADLASLQRELRKLYPGQDEFEVISFRLARQG